MFATNWVELDQNPFCLTHSLFDSKDLRSRCQSDSTAEGGWATQSLVLHAEQPSYRQRSLHVPVAVLAVFEISHGEGSQTRAQLVLEGSPVENVLQACVGGAPSSMATRGHATVIVSWSIYTL
jgi:hypothetical protein